MKFTPNHEGYGVEADDGSTVCAVVVRVHDLKDGKPIPTRIHRDWWRINFTGRSLTIPELTALLADMPKD